jgi:hypothetical protein
MMLIEENRQLSLFDAVDGEPVAVSLFTGERLRIEEPKRLVPVGHYIVMVGAHPLVLAPVDIAENEVEPGLRYMHYTIDDAVYAGTFVG